MGNDLLRVLWGSCSFCAASSVLYTHKNSLQKNPSSKFSSHNSLFHTKHTTFRHISSPDPLTQFQLLTEFSLPEHSCYLFLFRSHHSATTVRSIFLSPKPLALLIAFPKYTQNISAAANLSSRQPSPQLPCSAAPSPAKISWSKHPVS